MAITETQNARLRALNANAQFTIQGPTHKENERTGRMVTIHPGGARARIQDRETKQFYPLIGEGVDKMSALDAALDLAEKTPPPKTKTQLNFEAKSGEAAAAAEERSRVLEAENAELRRQLAAVKGGTGTTPPAMTEDDVPNDPRASVRAALKKAGVAFEGRSSLAKLEELATEHGLEWKPKRTMAL